MQCNETLPVADPTAFDLSDVADESSDDETTEAPETVSDPVVETLGLAAEVDDRCASDIAINRKRRRRRREVPRSKVYAIRKLKRLVEDGRTSSLPLFDDQLRGEDYDRPRTRDDCREGAINGERPCPWVSCKHHLYLDINPENGSLKINFPDLEPWELKHSCALDIADAGAVTLEEVGEIMNLTRERIRQLEVRGLIKLKFDGNLSDPNEG